MANQQDTTTSQSLSNIGICYFNHGTKHLARLVVSLRSLEMWWAERQVAEALHGTLSSSFRPAGTPVPVAILHTPAKWNAQAAEIIQRIPDAFPSLDIQLVEIPLSEHRRHSCYVTKSTLWRYSPFDTTLLIDADTMVVGEFRNLFDWAEDPKMPGVVVTRFSKWHTQGNIVSGRVRQWKAKKVACEAINVKRAAAKAIEYPWPALNTGVVCWRKGAEILGAWEELTRAGWRCSFTDELAMQLLITEFPHTLVGDEYNWSPIYGKAEKEDVRIIHFHGNKQLRSEAAGTWWPVYEECVRDDVAGVREWTPGGDKRLGAFIGERLGLAG